ncbi:non-specific lipid-transfer protein 8-like [Tasmannia lanceolata]|uniref:non-specific lipid-transfer protein 8-like n=1 Tax=Tasmannia lanceolata TaxID=3420 RepID=UPI004063093F
MKFSSIMVPASAALVLLLLLIPTYEAAIQCSDVLKDLTPCLNYLINGNGKPSQACCGGVSKLAASASTSADRKAVCTCIKSAAQQMHPNSGAAQALPGSCRISLPFAVSPNVDCSKIT